MKSMYGISHTPLPMNVCIMVCSLLVHFRWRNVKTSSSDKRPANLLQILVERFHCSKRFMGGKQERIESCVYFDFLHFGFCFVQLWFLRWNNLHHTN
ncbi:hypothetical protein F4809DRAFT_447761 [Biscogniauxia mediterranea]|nr:hypothetical protein F4809DRAFT_447761 [Biscogniauxia mediterranea]